MDALLYVYLLFLMLDYTKIENTMKYYVLSNFLFLSCEIILRFGWIMPGLSLFYLS